MKKTYLFIMVFAAILASCGNKNSSSSNSAENNFKSEKYNFSANFPATPKESTESTPTEVGNIDLVMFMHDASDKAYFIGVSDMPKALVDASNKNDLIQGGKTGALGQLENSKILSEKNITIGKHPGLEFEAEGTTSGISVYMKGRYYMVDNRLYQVYVMAQQPGADKAEITKFVESFKLLKE